MSDIKIGFGITEDWLKYTYVTICSILSNADKNDNYKFYLLTTKEDENSEKIHEKLYNIHPFEYEFIEINNSEFENYLHDMRVGISALYRLKLPSLTNEDKILYLDSDVVILNNIAELWNININDYYIGAVEDKYSELMTCHAGLSEEDIYINSGVLLMNLKKFRENNLEEIIFKKLKENDTYSDQDVLNDVCKNNILYLPLKYNLMVTRDDPNSFPKRKTEYKQALKSPVILHYAIKPWIIPVQYSEYWKKYHDMIY